VKEEEMKLKPVRNRTQEDQGSSGDAGTRDRCNAIIEGPVPQASVPSQRLFGPKAAAKYLGICEDTLKKITDLKQIPAFNLNRRRAYRLEDLSAFVESLPGWYDSRGEKSA
jgi:hypothetical protein